MDTLNAPHGVQAVLLVRHQHPVEPIEHVRQLHSVASGHYRQHPEAGYHPVLLGLRPVPPASQALGQS